MAGIYFHIPFCKQACSYCNFHFSTNQKLKDQMLLALHKELDLWKDQWQAEKIETIYFGGGTPSLYPPQAIQELIDHVRSDYHVTAHPEITMECNPDDVTERWLASLGDTEVNRLSLGIQSFDEDVLRFMHRAHGPDQAISSLELIRREDRYALSADLIYGLPGQGVADWKRQLDRIREFSPDHLSCYQLTIEPKTALAHQVKKGLTIMPPDESVIRQFDALMDFAGEAGFDHYEISNLCKPGHIARHNTSYWQGKPYLGIGPAAHSYKENLRWWNIPNNPRYIDEINQGNLPFDSEELGPTEKYNEYIMTGLRTKWGVDIRRIREFGDHFEKHFLLESADPLKNGELRQEESGRFVLTRTGKYIADGIAAGLFYAE